MRIFLFTLVFTSFFFPWLFAAEANQTFESQLNLCMSTIKPTNDPKQYHTASDCINAYLSKHIAEHPQYRSLLLEKISKEKRGYTKNVFLQALASLHDKAAIDASFSMLDTSNDELERKMIVFALIFNSALEPTRILAYLDDHNEEIAKIVATYYYKNKTDDAVVRNKMMAIINEKNHPLLGLAIAYCRALSIKIELAPLNSIIAGTQEIDVFEEALHYTAALHIKDSNIDATILQRRAHSDQAYVSAIDAYQKLRDEKYKEIAR